jgi:hypothetical protein
MDIPKEIGRDWSEYTHLRSSGLKKKANQLLLSIVKMIEKQGVEKFKGFLYALCEEGFSDNDEKKIQHPIFVRCVLPLLIEGYKSNSIQELIFIVKANGHGFGGIIYDAIGDVSNQKHLKSALETDPSNIEVINLLAQEYVESLYFGAHHLPDCLIVELEYANSLIGESSQFIEQYRGVIDARYIESHQYYLQLYGDYQVWNAGEFQYDFKEWCEKNKKTYHWVKSYYYE